MDGESNSPLRLEMVSPMQDLGPLVEEWKNIYDQRLLSTQHSGGKASN
jgi:hypothetical protein